MPTVWNKRDKNTPADAIYVGRPHLLGNPYTHLPAGNTLAEFHVVSREVAIQKYTERLQNIISAELKSDGPRPYFEAVIALYDKDLVCWCAPLACHGHVLVKMAHELYWLDVYKSGTPADVDLSNVKIIWGEPSQ